MCSFVLKKEWKTKLDKRRNYALPQLLTSFLRTEFKLIVILTFLFSTIKHTHTTHPGISYSTFKCPEPPTSLHPQIFKGWDPETQNHLVTTLSCCHHPEATSSFSEFSWYFICASHGAYRFLACIIVVYTYETPRSREKNHYGLESQTCLGMDPRSFPHKVGGLGKIPTLEGLLFLFFWQNIKVMLSSHDDSEDRR